MYVRPVDAWIDPSRPKPRAMITHGHSDHARPGHGAVLATPQTLAIMECRYGPQAAQPVAYDESICIGDTRVRFVPAGHVLGSAQIVIDHRGERAVVSGDYKRRFDPTCAPFVPVPCDIFVTEATFGLPVFRHPDTASEIDRLLGRLHADPSRCIQVGAYALGKAQRIICELRSRGHQEPIYFHGALERLNRLYESFGISLGELRPVAGAGKRDIAGRIVICPPAALNDRWSRRLPNPVTAMASGWMRIRQRARQSNVELPLIISDHADWDELTTTIRELEPREVWITHGREEALKHWCTTHRFNAVELNLVGFEDEED
ncbi:MAG TPA: ligase-associated DNA damage response exonuclease [Sphingomicrobium sp.]|nr:ligase-associated DNA damage response exonuclease [Sphingomicrobium sp.]